MINRVVEVLHDRGPQTEGSRWSAGSGYLIGGSLVLTAAHCVGHRTEFGAGERVQVRLMDGQTLAADVILAAPDGVAMDIAVLELRNPPAGPAPALVPFAEVDRATPVPLTSCWAIGFPGFAKAGPVLPTGSKRESWQVIGTVLPGGKLRAGLLVLEVTSGPRPPQGDLAKSPWSGMSGAVVFAPGPGADHAVGVVAVHHRPEGESTLTVVPVTALADLAGEQRWRTEWRDRLLGHRLAIVPPPSEEAERRSRLSGELALREHWDPRGRGVERAAQPGSYFTGRREALSELNAWLGADPDPTDNVRVITGGPGSGKSAVLARLVIAAASPGDGATIDVAVHARAARTGEVFDAVAAAAGRPGTGRAELVDGLPRYGFTVAIDALDEADDPLGLARELRRLAVDGMEAGVRILAATRPGGPERRLLTAFGLTVRHSDRAVVDLDLPRFLSRDDLAEYVRRRLLLTGAEPQPGRRDTPYRGQEELAATVAQQVAGAAHPAFLIGQLVSRFLVLRGSVLTPSDPLWNTFPTTVAAAMDQYLAGMGTRAAQDRVEDLLRPLAYARGDGLPLDDTVLWPLLATALARSGRRYTARDVAELLETAADYLIETVVSGDASYYRLYHQALSDRLVELDGQRSRPVGSAELIFECLLGTVPRTPGGPRDWRTAHPYLLDHLAAHALDAGRLDELLDDPGFLVAAAPSGLFGTLQRYDRPMTDNGRVYQQAHPYLSRGADHAAERAAYLQLAAERDGSALAGSLGRLDLPRAWTPRWVRGARPDPHYIAGRHQDAVNAVATGLRYGRPVIVSAGDDDTIRVWDLQSGKPVLEPLTGHEGGVNAVSIAERRGRPVIVSGSFDETIMVWDLLTGEVVAGPLSGHEEAVNATVVAERHGRQVIVSGSADNTLRVWDLESGEPVGEPLTGHESAVFAVAAGERHGRPVIVSASADTTLRVWDLESGEPVGGPLTGHAGQVDAVAVGHREGRAILVSTSADGIRRWDLESLEPIGAPLTGHAGTVYAVTPGRWRDRPVVVTGGADQTIRIWDLESGTILRPPFHGHDGEVASVVFGERHGRPVLLSGSLDETVRVWDIDADRPSSGPVAAHDGGVNAVATGVIDQRPVVVSGGYDCTVRLWDLASGEPLLDPFTGHVRDVMAVCTGMRRERPVAVSGSYDGLVRVWDLISGTFVLGPIAAHDAPVLAVRVAVRRDRPVIVTGSGAGAIGIWDLDDGTALSAPLTGHTGQVNALAVARRSGRPVLISAGDDEAVRVWDLDLDLGERAPLPPMTAHEAPVYALAVTERAGRPVVVSAGADDSLRVWDLESGKQVCPPLLGHDGLVRALAAGTWRGRPVIVSGSDDDRTVRVWDLDATEPAVQRIDVQRRVMSVDMAGDRVVIGTTGELVRIDLI